eukprot:scaffold3368_cov92-Amphora_coffeaeformis.AAC.1
MGKIALENSHGALSTCSDEQFSLVSHVVAAGFQQQGIVVSSNKRHHEGKFNYSYIHAWAHFLKEATNTIH